MHYHRDGAMRFDGNFGSAPNYEPNSFNGPVENPEYRERPRTITGSVDRHNHRLDHDYNTQPGLLPSDEAECEEAPDQQYRRELGEHA